MLLVFTVLNHAPDLVSHRSPTVCCDSTHLWIDFVYTQKHVDVGEQSVILANQDVYLEVSQNKGTPQIIQYHPISSNIIQYHPAIGVS